MKSEKKIISVGPCFHRSIKEYQPHFWPPAFKCWSMHLFEHHKVCKTYSMVPVCLKIQQTYTLSNKADEVKKKVAYQMHFLGRSLGP